MGLGNALADAMLEGRAASAESQATRVLAELRDVERRYEKDIGSFKSEITKLRATIIQQQEALNTQLAQSLCAQAMVNGFVVLMLKSKGDPQLEKIRESMALEARKIMQTNDLRYAQNPQWVSLIETCKKSALNEHLKVV